MRIIITGACGHIGSYLVANLYKIKKIKSTILIDNFATQSEAESRANQMGGEGSHSHNGFYMPFNTHQEYLDNISDESKINE